MKILAIIVTYNPEIGLLRKNIAALYTQVDHILVCDNASKNAHEINKLLSEFPNITYIPNAENLGLPINYNRGIEFCVEEGYDWLLTMDQDTIVPEDLIEEYSNLFFNEKIAIISPVFVDNNISSVEDERQRLPDEKYTIVNDCISSASINRVSTLVELGGFDERMFIDFVDYDYCWNVTSHGYLIYRCNKVFITHQIGNEKWVRLLGHDTIAYNHSPIRSYYYFRNRVYFAKKHKLSILYEREYYRSMIVQFLVLFCESQTMKKVHQAIKGIHNGLHMRVEKNK